MNNNISIPKAGIQGLALGAITRFNEPNARVLIPMINQRVPLYVLSGIAGLSASIIGDVAHSYVLPHIPVLKKYNQQESAIMSPLINAGAYLGTYYIANPDTISRIGAFNLTLEAVATDIGSHYVADNFFSAYQ